MSLNIVFCCKKVVSLDNLNKLSDNLLRKIFLHLDLLTLTQLRTISKQTRIFVVKNHAGEIALGYATFNNQPEISTQIHDKDDVDVNLKE